MQNYQLIYRFSTDELVKLRDKFDIIYKKKAQSYEIEQ